MAKKRSSRKVSGILSFGPQVVGPGEGSAFEGLGATSRDRMRAIARKHFDTRAVVFDLLNADWYWSEPRRLDRMVYIGTVDGIESLLSDEMPRAWAKAKKEGYENELVDEFAEALGEAVAKMMKEHVYVTFEVGDVYAGQYEDFRDKDEGRKWVAKRKEKIEE
jgi:hypothetical protein